MNRNTIAIVLIAALCILMVAPMYADAAGFLVALPAIWAVLAAAGVTVAMVNYNDDSKQTQQAANTHNEPSVNESQTNFAKAETSTTFCEECFGME